LKIFAVVGSKKKQPIKGKNEPFFYTSEGALASLEIWKEKEFRS
jgi:hypothetical protein